MRSFTKSQEQEFSLIGELWAFNQLEKRGYQPETVTDFFERNCDIRVGKLPVEVKIARPTYRWFRRGETPRSYTRWQWHISPTAAQMDNEWLLILIAQDQHFVMHPFILPGSAVQDRTHIQITSHPLRYRGWLSHWLNQWDVVAYLTQASFLNGGPLYHEWAKRQAA